MNCKICDDLQKNEVIYYDDQVIITSALDPFIFGHLQIFSRKHYSIFEQVPDSEAMYLFNIANRLSMILFDSLHSQGTNIFVQNGVPAGQSIAHFSIHIIPRKENDSLNLIWNPKQAKAEDLESTLKRITDVILPEETQPVVAVKEPKPVEVIKQEKGEKENYLLKQLRKLP